MKEWTYTIRDRLGLHARPASYLVKMAASFPCRVTVESGGKTADAKKVFSVIGLNVKHGQEIILRTEGEREEEAILELGRFLEENM